MLSVSPDKLPKYFMVGTVWISVIWGYFTRRWYLGFPISHEHGVWNRTSREPQTRVVMLHAMGVGQENPTHNLHFDKKSYGLPKSAHTHRWVVVWKNPLIRISHKSTFSQQQKLVSFVQSARPAPHRLALQSTFDIIPFSGFFSCINGKMIPFSTILGGGVLEKIMGSGNFSEVRRVFN